MSFDSTVLSPRNANQHVASTPANPAGTTSLTNVMMGLAQLFTPKTTGRFIIEITGELGNNTTADGTTVQIATGTGTAPANGAASTGTARGNPVTFTSLTGVLRTTFSLIAIVTGLPVGTAHWMDLLLKAVTAGTASLTSLTVSIIEF